MNKKISLFPSDGVERFHTAVAGMVLRAGGAPASAKAKWVSVPGLSEGRAAPNQCHLLACQKVQEGRADRVLSGWRVENFTRKATGRMSLLLSHHSVVINKDGSLGCPSSTKGETVLFFGDAFRTADLASLKLENMFVVGTEPMELMVGDYRETIPAYTLARAVDTDWGFLMSVNPKHGQWVEFAHQDPFAFARSIGANPRNLFDMSFVSDLTLLLPQLSKPSGWNPFEADDREVAAVLEGLEEAVKAGLIVARNKRHQAVRDEMQAPAEASA